MVYTIYKHTNTVTGKCYVGKTIKPWQVRWAAHIIHAFENGGAGRFHCALRDFGLAVWSSEVLETVETLEAANQCECAWIQHFNSFEDGYNMTPGGDGGCTEEMKVKIGNALRGKPKSEAHKQKMREAAEEYWASHPDDQRKEQLIARNQSDTQREALREGQNRRWSDPEARAEMSRQQKGKVLSEETKAKIAEANKGRKLTDEQRQKMSEKRKAMWADPEFRAMMLEKRKKA